MESGITIAEMSERSGVGVHTLRYYEREGLLEPVARNEGGHRRYRESDLAAVDFLTKMRLTGMGISDLREFARLIRQGEGTAARRRAMLARHRERVCARLAELESCLGFIDYKIEMYERMESCSPAETK